jgi:hypothetical protein
MVLVYRMNLTDDMRETDFCRLLLARSSQARHWKARQCWRRLSGSQCWLPPRPEVILRALGRISKCMVAYTPGSSDSLLWFKNVWILDPESCSRHHVVTQVLAFSNVVAHAPSRGC